MIVGAGARCQAAELTWRMRCGNHYAAYFFGGAFLCNAVPHFTQGLSGRTFPSPFSSPPGVGPSSPTVNILWGTFNLLIGYLLVCRVGSFNLRSTRDVTVFGVGWVPMAVMLARAFGEVCAR